MQERKAIDWEAWRLVVAIAHAGTLVGGARLLAIDHSTAFRRLGSLEGRLGVRLFDRARDGYVPTPAGEAVVEVAARFAEEVAGLELRLAGRDIRPTGTVRVTTTDTLLDLLAPHLAAFRAAHPGISVELVVANAFLTLTRRDADVAVRPSAEPPESLVGRRVGTIATALYAAPVYLQRRSPDTALAGHDWIGPDESLGHLGSARWLAREIPAERVVLRVSSLLAARAAAQAGLGVAALPCYLADADARLVRLHRRCRRWRRPCGS